LGGEQKCSQMNVVRNERTTAARAIAINVAAE